MSTGVFVWFIGFAMVLYTIDRLVSKWIDYKMKDCKEVYSETGVEDEEDIKSDNGVPSGNGGTDSSL